MRNNIVDYGSYSDTLPYLPQTYSEQCQTYKMECFANIDNDFQPLTIFAKRSILGVWEDSEYTSVHITLFISHVICATLSHASLNKWGLVIQSI